MVAEAISSAGDAEQAGQGLRCASDPGRLVALAAIGGGGQPGRVGFDEDAVERQRAATSRSGCALG